MDRERQEPEPVEPGNTPQPPPFDPDPNLVSFLERGPKDDPKRAWTDNVGAGRQG